MMTRFLHPAHVTKITSSLSSTMKAACLEDEEMSSGASEEEEAFAASNNSKEESPTKKSRKSSSSGNNPLISPTEKCKVCHEPAAKHIHYGSVTCFSCRAFFRRSIQNKTARAYSCRRQGCCDVRHKGRKNCQKCRFDRCMEAGMKPSWVLSEDERHKRFRKTREKKQQQQKKSSSEGAGVAAQEAMLTDDTPPSSPQPSQAPAAAKHAEPLTHPQEVAVPGNTSSLHVLPAVHPQPGSHSRQESCAPTAAAANQPARNPLPSTSSQGLTLQPRQASKVRATMNIKMQPVVTSSDSNAIVPSPPRPLHQSLACFDDEDDDGNSSDSSVEAILVEPLVEISADELARIRHISDEHDIQYKSVPFGEELIKEMVMCSVFAIPLSTSAAMTAYRLMIQRVTKVAQAFDPFLDLPHATQSALLKQNADLLVSLRGAVFFEDKKKGLDQILFSLGVEDVEIGKKLIVKTLKSVGRMGRIDYRNFNSLQRTNTDEASESRYDKLLSRVGAAVSCRPEYVRLLSYIILFSPDFAGLHGDRRRVERVQQMFIGMLKRFIFSQFPRRIAVSAFANVLSTVADLQELTHIKKQRALAAPVTTTAAAEGVMNSRA